MTLAKFDPALMSPYPTVQTVMIIKQKALSKESYSPSFGISISNPKSRELNEYTIPVAIKTLARIVALMIIIFRLTSDYSANGASEFDYPGPED